MKGRCLVVALEIQGVAEPVVGRARARGRSRAPLRTALSPPEAYSGARECHRARALKLASSGRSRTAPGREPPPSRRRTPAPLRAPARGALSKTPTPCASRSAPGRRCRRPRSPGTPCRFSRRADSMSPSCRYACASAPWTADASGLRSRARRRWGSASSVSSRASCSRPMPNSAIGVFRLELRRPAILLEGELVLVCRFEKLSPQTRKPARSPVSGRRPARQQRERRAHPYPSARARGDSASETPRAIARLPGGNTLPHPPRADGHEARCRGVPRPRTNPAPRAPPSEPRRSSPRPEAPCWSDPGQEPPARFGKDRCGRRETRPAPQPGARRRRRARDAASGRAARCSSCVSEPRKEPKTGQSKLQRPRTRSRGKKKGRAAGPAPR